MKVGGGGGVGVVGGGGGEIQAISGERGSMQCRGLRRNQNSKTGWYWSFTSGPLSGAEGFLGTERERGRHLKTGGAPRHQKEQREERMEAGRQGKNAGSNAKDRKRVSTARKPETPKWWGGGGGGNSRQKKNRRGSTSQSSVF